MTDFSYVCRNQRIIARLVSGVLQHVILISLLTSLSAESIEKIQYFYLFFPCYIYVTRRNSRVAQETRKKIGSLARRRSVAALYNCANV